jgi:hypothetical protein
MKHPNYKHTQIYLIYCKDESITDVYVGHTTNFSERYESHEKSVDIVDRRLYNFIRKHGGWSNWDMKVLSEVSCSNRGEASLEELYWYITMNATLNICTPGLYYFNRSMVSDKLYQKRKNVLDQIVTAARYPPRLI